MHKSEILEEFRLVKGRTWSEVKLKQWDSMRRVE